MQRERAADVPCTRTQTPNGMGCPWAYELAGEGLVRPVCYDIQGDESGTALLLIHSTLRACINWMYPSSNPRLFTTQAASINALFLGSDQLQFNWPFHADLCKLDLQLVSPIVLKSGKEKGWSAVKSFSFYIHFDLWGLLSYALSGGC